MSGDAQGSGGGPSRSDRGGAQARARDAARRYRPLSSSSDDVAQCSICMRICLVQDLRGCEDERCALCDALEMVRHATRSAVLLDDEESLIIADLQTIYNRLRKSSVPETPSTN